ncbi:MAG TPA: hypothetical protein VKV15_12500 [Bryobacteraceae bacterium]|nr:hypothetical protein [Bryobacteraceae bacterium]
MQLTEAEASVRALNSELSIRPLFHQLEPRAKAHVMVALLGYALWVTPKHLLKRRPALVPQPSQSGADKAQPLSAIKALALLSTLQSADIALPTTDGRETVCAASPNPPPGRNRFSGISVSAYPSASNSTANVVQTWRLPELILKGLGDF